MHTPYQRALIFAAMSIAGAGALAQEAEYHWPLNLPRILTSSFGEYRDGRFHMGIDLRTGPVGQPVYAADNGYVSRLRCSPYGYGKAVYLQLESGDSIVYGHLDAFNHDLTEHVRAAQHARENYTVDLHFEPGRFPVTRGELLAYAGQTGVGVPHLHYELRDASGAPINPRLRGVTWPDTTAPVFSKVAIVPASPDTLVNGDLLPVLLNTETAGAQRYRTSPVTVDGPVAFAIEVVDPANGGGTKLGVHTIETRAADTTIFRVVHDRIDYAHGQDGAVAYHPYLIDQGRFLVQWRWPGNDTAAYAYPDGDGRFLLESESAEVQIVATDFWGNACALTIPMKQAGADVPVAAGEVAASPERQTGETVYSTFGEWLLVTTRFNAPEPNPPVLLDAAAGEQWPMRRINGRTYRAAYAPPAGTDEAALAVEHAALAFEPRRFLVATRGERPLAKTLGGVDVSTAPDSPYGQLFIAVDRVEPPAPGAELVPFGNAYVVGDNYAPIEASVGIALPIPDDVVPSQRHSVYRHNGRAWRPVNTRIENGRAHVQTTTLGLFQLFEDTAAPAVALKTPAANATTIMRPEIKISIRDEGSGIAEANAWANGRWLLMAYDPEENALEWERDTDLETGDNVIEVRVVDVAGNVSELARRIRVSG